jgi:hypothetical protein
MSVYGSDSIIGPKLRNEPSKRDNVLTKHDFFYSIDGPCWVYGILFDSVVTDEVDTGLYSQTVSATFWKDFISGSFPNYSVMKLDIAEIIPIGFCTDGVTVEAYENYDLVPVGSNQLRLDDLAVSLFVGRGGRLAVHAHFNVVCKIASRYIKTLLTGCHVSPSVLSVPGNQAVGLPESGGQNISGRPDGTIWMMGRQSIYTFHNAVASPTGRYFPCLAVKQVMTERFRGMTNPNVLSDKLTDFIIGADLFVLNVLFADPYIAFMGQQPSFVEAKFVSFGISIQPTPVGLADSGVNQKPIGVPDNLPEGPNIGRIIAVRSHSAGNDKIYTKAHCGNYPSCVSTDSVWYHFFGWSAKRMGSMI